MSYRIVDLERRFGSYRRWDVVQQIDKYLRSSKRARCNKEVADKVGEKRDAVDFLLKRLSEYKDEKGIPFVKRIKKEDIVNRYLEEIWKVDSTNHVILKSTIANKLRDVIMYNHDGKYYHHISEDQVIPTALYFLDRNREMIISTYQEKKNRVDSKKLPPDELEKMFGPILRDLKELEKTAHLYK